MAHISREQKNKNISDAISATRKKRKSQIPLTFELGVRNEKRNRKTGCFHHLKMICVEAKWMKNNITSILNADRDKSVFQMKDKDFKKVTHRDKDGNELVSELKYLRSSLRKGVIEKYQKSVTSLAGLKRNGHKVGRIKFESEHKTVYFMQYGITHYISGPNSIHIQGFNHDIRVSGLRQLRKLDELGIAYDLSTMDMHMVCDTCFKFFLTVWVDKEEYTKYKNSKREERRDTLREKGVRTHSLNAYDLGSKVSATDAYGNQVYVAFEETPRLKRCQQQLARQRRAAEKKDEEEGNKTRTISVRQYNTRQRMKKEYYRISRRKDAAAIGFVKNALDQNDVVIIQDEQLNNWKRKKKRKNKHGKVVKCKGCGRKIQHSILGRIKKRLVASPQVHVIDKWVPTTKLCTHCGKIHKNIQLSDRTYICPHCGHNDGDRDAHSARDMVWLYYFMPDKIGLDGSEFKRGDFDNSLAEIFSAENPCSYSFEDEQASCSQKDEELLSANNNSNPDKEIIEG